MPTVAASMEFVFLVRAALTKLGVGTVAALAQKERTYYSTHSLLRNRLLGTAALDLLQFLKLHMVNQA